MDASSNVEDLLRTQFPSLEMYWGDLGGSIAPARLEGSFSVRTARSVCGAEVGLCQRRRGSVRAEPVSGRVSVKVRRRKLGSGRQMILKAPLRQAHSVTLSLDHSILDISKNHPIDFVGRSFRTFSHGGYHKSHAQRSQQEGSNAVLMPFAPTPFLCCDLSNS